MLRVISRRTFDVVASAGHKSSRTVSATRHWCTETKRDGDSERPSADSAPPPDDATPTRAEPMSEAENEGAQLAEKDAQLAALNDRTLRVLAEMENVRMIARRDVDNAKRYAIMPFANALLSVADNLGLALKAVPNEALEGNAQLQGLFAGVGATEAELLKVFSQHGISRFGGIGDRFDPNRYQAVFEAPSADHEPGTVIDVTKLGYAIGDRILRPAEVGVSKSP